MNALRKKRLIIILAILVGVGAAVGLALSALQENINLFYTPTQIANGDRLSSFVLNQGQGVPKAGEVRLNLRGDVTLGSEKVAVEKLRAEFDRKTISGRLSYVFAAGSAQAKLDAALNALGPG